MNFDDLVRGVRRCRNCGFGVSAGLVTDRCRTCGRTEIHWRWIGAALTALLLAVAIGVALGQSPLWQ